LCLFSQTGLLRLLFRRDGCLSRRTRVQTTRWSLAQSSTGMYPPKLKKSTQTPTNKSSRTSCTLLSDIPLVIPNRLSRLLKIKHSGNNTKLSLTPPSPPRRAIAVASVPKTVARNCEHGRYLIALYHLLLYYVTIDATLSHFPIITYYHLIAFLLSQKSVRSLEIGEILRNHTLDER